jgi:hypothetical protein
VDDAVRGYIDALSPEQRPLFDRVHGLITDGYPDVDVVLAYDMPTYVVDGRRLHVAVWAHGVSIYGWKAHHDGGFTDRHPDLRSGKGTIRLRTDAADQIADDELRDLIGSALDA